MCNCNTHFAPCYRDVHKQTYLIAYSNKTYLYYRVIDVRIVAGVHIDIRKCFYSISHTSLREKLHKIVKRENVHCLLKSYLMFRHKMQSAMVPNLMSNC